METFGVGTRMEKPSILPAISGITSFNALAAPVEVGIMEIARRTRPPQVFVREIKDHLIVGVGVNRRHRPADNLKIVMDDLGDWRQAIRRAGSIRNDVMLGRIVLVVVHPENQGNVLILGWSRDDHFLYRTAHVLLGIFGVGEATS